ncbi:hypothetical protein CRE_17423 [Caenorhabditis remanei]|uniref:Uncharacterized protein n=1 Tax=Caenorhabditis remanei TaxID=31234 RepID=E3N1Z5_CAERE|nr:hypothetical protein CRE_17423 [Caenorhabditis remanei]
MEGSIPPRSKPLSYDALKSVIKSMSVEKSDDDDSNDDDSNDDDSDDDDSDDDDSDNGDSNQTTISISYSQKSTPDFHVKESVDEVFEKIFNVYLKNGSTIQYFDFCHVPKFLCDRDGSDGLKLNISTLIMDNGFDNFDSFIRLVNLDNLEQISISLHFRLNELECRLSRGNSVSVRPGPSCNQTQDGSNSLGSIWNDCILALLSK